MKSVCIAMLLGIAADLPFGFSPKAGLLGMMFAAMVFDFITAIIKAKLLKEEITEKALTKTVIKFCQYGGAIAIGLSVSWLGSEVSKFNDTWKYTPQIMSFFNNSLLVFIIHIELRSIIKNLIAMDSKSQMAVNLLGPFLKVLSIRIKNNPIINMTIEADSEDDIPVTVEQKTIKSKNITK